MGNKEKASYVELFRYAWVLSKVIKHANINKRKIAEMRACFDNEDYKILLGKIMGSLCLKTKVEFGFMPDNLMYEAMRSMGGLLGSEELRGALFRNLHLESFRNREPGYVEVSDDIPLYGSRKFVEHATKMRIGETMRFQSFETFVSLLVHELMHILLFSIRNSLRNNEYATDMAMLFSGFRGIIRISKIKQHSGLGYLSEGQFRFACVLAMSLGIFGPILRKFNLKS